jgi:alkanesulfonate monooxygenase SsuD/methylene tetrahydromethanopterin reductase-like flavin-dependent oxidoreductase (luciferase family)
VNPIRLGLTLPSFRDDAQPLLAVARAAEAAGLDGVFAYDHLFRYGADGAVRPALEFAATIGALAAETDAIAIGSLVARATLRPPAVLANVFDTVRRIAGDRVVAGLGAGDAESRDEMVTFGYEFGTEASRVDALVASVEAVAARGVPTWVGGHPERTAPAVLRAAGWNRWGVPPERFAVEAEAVRSARAAAGRDPGVLSWGGLCVLGSDDDAAHTRAQRLGASPRTLVGGPETVAARVRDYVAAGAEWVILGPVDSSDPTNAELLAAVGEILRRG